MVAVSPRCGGPRCKVTCSITRRTKIRSQAVRRSPDSAQFLSGILDRSISFCIGCKIICGMCRGGAGSSQVCRRGGICYAQVSIESGQKDTISYTFQYPDFIIASTLIALARRSLVVTLRRRCTVAKIRLLSYFCVENIPSSQSKDLYTRPGSKRIFV